MTGLTDTLGLGNAIFREAARARHPEMDVEHVFLGLLAHDPQVAAGCARRGVTLTAVREAMVAVADQDLSRLGISGAPRVTPRRLEHQDAEHSGSIPFTARARDLVSRMESGSVEMLRECLAEPSGTNRRLVETLGADPAALISATEDAQNERTQPFTHVAPQGMSAASADGFLALPLQQVWSVVTDPYSVAKLNQGTSEGGVVTFGRGQRAEISTRRGPETGSALVVWTVSSETRPGDPTGEIAYELSKARAGTRVRVHQNAKGMGRLGRLLSGAAKPIRTLGAAHHIQHIAQLADDSA